jgi:phage/plasmid-associated DNA primase
MRRRLHLLPFAVTIPASESDLELTERLRNEQGGILEWMIEGCLGWQAEGLHRPAVVIDATESYLAAEDTLARWIEDRCVRGVNNRESSSVLFADWQEWASMNEEPCGSPKQFSEHMEARGFTKTRTNVARGFQGIGLRTKAVTDVTD